MTEAGRNPMRWDCNKGGPGMNCFNRVKRPKIEVFAECFPGQINFGDVDGIVEINGWALMLEWKPMPQPLQKGQAIMYQRLTQKGRKMNVLVVAGNAETMEVTAMMLWYNGKNEGWKTGSLEVVKRRIRRWVELASTNALSFSKEETAPLFAEVRL